VDGIAADPSYLDVWVPPGRRRDLPIDTSRNAFAYVFEGSGTFRDASEPRAVRTDKIDAPGSRAPDSDGDASPRAGDALRSTGGTGDEIGNRSLVLFDRGDSVAVRAGSAGIRFLLVSGQALREPVAWRGPIVMNTKDELNLAWRELRDGTFIKHQ
jgi:hypothetical protein